MEKLVVISLGGSVIVPNKINLDFLKRFVDFVKKKKERFIIVTGGGNVCRKYLSAMDEYGINDFIQRDLVGIRATQLNSEFVRTLFGELAYSEIQCDYTQKHEFKKVLLAAGWKSGCSTDLDSFELAHTYGSHIVINLTNVDYVYDKDPKKYSDALILKKLNWDEYIKMSGKVFSPGMHLPFDPVASLKAKEYKIKVVIMSGLDNLKKFLYFSPRRS
jgi:uridylate kinase